MSEVDKKGIEVETGKGPDKHVVVIDPISKPLEYADKAIKQVNKAAKKTTKAIKGLFK